MTDPRRLLDDPALRSSDERALLEAWSAMRAPSRARTQILGLAGGIAAGSIAPAAGAVPQGATGAAVTMTSAATKWIVLGTLLSALALPGAALLLRSESATAGVMTRTMPKADPTPNVAEVAAGASTLTEAELQAVPVDALPSAPLSTSHPLASSETQTIAAELAALDGIRDDLAAGRTEQALARMDRFDARYPKSALREEATVLRFDAHRKRGDARSAERVARAFLEAYPMSPYASRLRQWLEGQ